MVICTASGHYIASTYHLNGSVLHCCVVWNSYLGWGHHRLGWWWGLREGEVKKFLLDHFDLVSKFSQCLVALVVLVDAGRTQSYLA